MLPAVLIDLHNAVLLLPRKQLSIIFNFSFGKLLLQN